MRGLNRLMFGVLSPLLQVALVVAGLGLLGWGGVVYTLTGTWPQVRLGALWAAGAGPGGLLDWIGAMPLHGACIGAAIGLFFLLSPAYEHA